MRSKALPDCSQKHLMWPEGAESYNLAVTTCPPASLELRGPLAGGGMSTMGSGLGLCLGVEDGDITLCWCWLGTELWDRTVLR